MTDLIVRGNVFYCDKHHELEDLAGEVEVIDKYNNIHTYLVPIVLCKSCNVYYILEETYQELKKYGRIRAQIVSYEKYLKGVEGLPWELKAVSELKALGYTVSEEEGLTSYQRQSILEDIIDCKIMTKGKVLSYLDFFIKLNQHKDNMALEKWKKDREYIAGYDIGTSKKVKVGAIIVLEYSK
jgi:hypothetical protein